MPKIDHSQVRPGDPCWLEIARGEIGQCELDGDDHNARIVAYHATTTLKATDDETPWCSSFVNWVMHECDLPGTDSALARSWLKWGKVIDEPKVGAIVVMRRGASESTGHVGFVVGWNDADDTIDVLGGNQGNAVSVRTFKASSVLGYRVPKSLTDSKTVGATIVAASSEAAISALEAATAPSSAPALSRDELSTFMTLLQASGGHLKIVLTSIVFAALAYVVLERFRRMRRNGD